MSLRVGNPVDPDRLNAERWFAAAGARVKGAWLEERFALRCGGALGIVRVQLARGPSTRYTFPLDDGTAFWSDLAHLALLGGVIPGDAGGSLVGSPKPGDDGGRAAAKSGPAPVRPLGIDQSNSSVVIGDELVLKLYRRLVPGRNPEAELLGALADVADAPVPAIRGTLRALVSDMTRARVTDIGVVQQYVAGAADEFERFADALAERLRLGTAGAPDDPVLADVRASGRTTAELHVALGRLKGRALSPRPATRADQDRWGARAARAWRAAERSMRPLDESIADDLLERRPEIVAALRPLGDAPVKGQLTRIHGDLHVGQLIRDDSRFLVADFEGDPTQSVRSRRRRDLPLRDLATMLRSFDHVARSATRRAGSVGDPGGADAWLAQARAAYLASYTEVLAAHGANPELDPALLHALEMEKELYEFTYAASYLPAWRYAPAGGLRWLLDRAAA